jgi:hypothetical protein
MRASKDLANNRISPVFLQGRGERKAKVGRCHVPLTSWSLVPQSPRLPPLRRLTAEVSEAALADFLSRTELVPY